MNSLRSTVIVCSITGYSFATVWHVLLQVAKGVAQGDKARLQEAMAGMFVKGETQDMNNSLPAEVCRTKQLIWRCKEEQVKIRDASQPA
jgi:hypothetical protein